MSTAPQYGRFDFWIVGDTPLICHAWSLKAKEDMLAKQAKAVKDAHPPRDPQDDYETSIYELVPGSGQYGFPLGAIKNCLMSVAHKDRGVPKTTVRAALQMRGVITRVPTALAGAICEIPLVRVYGGEPQQREDMVRIGQGLKKTANLRYRAQFWPWAIYVTGKVNTRMLPTEALAFLAREGGVTSGIGDWRNEKDGIFGAFHVAPPKEQKIWDAFASGKGPLPKAKPWASMDDDFYADEAA